jgi:hypothetical protein
MIKGVIYDLYKPLRNHLRKVSVENAFYVIWAYINFFQFGQDFPLDIEVDTSIIKNKKLPRKNISEWELALLAREAIANGETIPSLATEDLKKWNYFARAINKIKDFENGIWPTFGNETNILKEMRRIAHRQFPWQSRPNSSLFLRYFKVYNNLRLKEIIENRLGLSVQQWYTIGTALSGAILTHPKVSIDPDVALSNITKKEFDIFLRFTAADLAKLNGIIERDVKYDDQYVYTLNPLEYFPLVRLGDYYYCPVNTFLAWRITSGIYFDLIGDKKFGHPFGLAFQEYLEEVSVKVLNPTRTKVLHEQKYRVSNTEEDSADIILAQTDAAVFVEAKAKRMQVRSKSQILRNEAMEQDLDILAGDIAQVYATIEDYRNGHYPHFPYQQATNIYPLVVTLENWFLFGEDAKRLREKVKQKMEDKNLPYSFTEEMPYIVCSASNYECFVQVLNFHTINEVMSAWFTPDKEDYNFGQFLSTTYHQEYKTINDFFPGDFHKIYPVLNMG